MGYFPSSVDYRGAYRIAKSVLAEIKLTGQRADDFGRCAADAYLTVFNIYQSKQWITVRKYLSDLGISRFYLVTVGVVTVLRAGPII